MVPWLRPTTAADRIVSLLAWGRVKGSRMGLGVAGSPRVYSRPDLRHTGRACNNYFGYKALWKSSCPGDGLFPGEARPSDGGAGTDGSTFDE